MEQDKVKYFRIKKNGRISCIMRDELLESDPVSIVLQANVRTDALHLQIHPKGYWAIFRCLRVNYFIV